MRDGIDKERVRLRCPYCRKRVLNKFDHLRESRECRVNYTEDMMEELWNLAVSGDKNGKKKRGVPNGRAQ